MCLTNQMSKIEPAKRRGQVVLPSRNLLTLCWAGGYRDRQAGLPPSVGGDAGKSQEGSCVDKGL